MDDLEPSLFARLRDQVRALDQRLEAEGQAWAISLTEARLNGPHRPGARIRISSPATIQNAIDDLSLQLLAYNTRNTALAQRCVPRPRDLVMIDLIEEEDTMPVSTETASSFASRLIQMLRVTLYIHARALSPIEDDVTAAFHALRAIMQNGHRGIDQAENQWHELHAIQYGPEYTEAFARAIEGLAERVVLAIQASMAKLGMKTVRQSIIDEYFQRSTHASAAGPEDDGGGGGDTEGGTHPGVIESAEQGIWELDCVSECEGRHDDRVRHRDDTMDHGEADGEEDETMDDASDYNFEEGTHQACITNYFSPLA